MGAVMAAIADSVSSAEAVLPVCLCEENLNRLVSLWDLVNIFKVGEFVELVTELGKWQTVALIDPGTGQRSVPELTKEALSTIANMHRFCLGVGFDECRQIAYRAKHHLSIGDPNSSVVAVEMDHLRRSLIEEASKRRFLRVSSGRAAFVDHRALFGKTVFKNFPSARNDIRDAGNCLASECNTAAIFHLMRAVEWALRALCVDLGFRRLRTINKKTRKVSYRLLAWQDWETILNQLNVRVGEQIAKAKRGPKKQLFQEFYLPALQDIEGFKDAWRNHVMHARREYSGDDSEAVFVHVRRFMTTLATRVSEV
jgi:hypothetical protein